MIKKISTRFRFTLLILNNQGIKNDFAINRYHFSNTRNFYEQMEIRLKQLQQQQKQLSSVSEKIKSMHEIITLKNTLVVNDLNRKSTSYEGSNSDLLILAKLYEQDGRIDDTSRIIDRIFTALLDLKFEEFPQSQNKTFTFLNQLSLYAASFLKTRLKVENFIQMLEGLNIQQQKILENQGVFVFDKNQELKVQEVKGFKLIELINLCNQYVQSLETLISQYILNSQLQKAIPRSFEIVMIYQSLTVIIKQYLNSSELQKNSPNTELSTEQINLSHTFHVLKTSEYLANIASIYLKLGEQNYTLQFIDASISHFNLLKNKQIVNELHPINIKTLVLQAQAFLQYKLEGLNQKLEYLETIFSRTPKDKGDLHFSLKHNFLILKIQTNQSDQPKLKLYLQELIELLKLKQDDPLNVYALKRAQMEYLSISGQHTKALEEADNLLQLISQDKGEQQKKNQIISDVLFIKGKLFISLKRFNEAFDVYEEIGNLQGVPVNQYLFFEKSMLYYEIFQLDKLQENIKNSRENFKKALIICLDLDQKQGNERCLHFEELFTNYFKYLAKFNDLEEVKQTITHCQTLIGKNYPQLIGKINIHNLLKNMKQ